MPIGRYTWPFLWYCKAFANLLFWVLGSWIAMPTKIYSMTLQESLKSICMQKSNFIPPFFLEILQRHCKLRAILRTFGMLGYGHKNVGIRKLAGNFDVYLHAKNQVYPSLLSWNLAKIMWTCFFGYSGHAWSRPPQTTVPTRRKLWCLSKYKKSTWSLTYFLRYKNPVIWLDEGILIHNLRIKILPGKGFAVKYK